jgi:hypothetical protein
VITRITIAALMAGVIAVFLTGVSGIDLLHHGARWLRVTTYFIVIVAAWEIYFRVDGV